MTQSTAAPARGGSTLVSIVAMLAFSVFRRALGLVSISVLSRLLTPAEVGAYAFAQTTGQTFVGLFRLGALQGLHVSLARRMPDDAGGDAGALIGGGILLVTAIALVGSTLMIALAVPIARHIFGAPELASYMLAATVFFAGQFLSRGAYVGFAGLGRFVEFTYYATAIGVVTVAVTILGAALYGVQGAVWAFAGTTLAGVPVYFVGLLRAMRETGVRMQFSLQQDHVRQIFAIGLPFYAAGVFVIPAEYVSQGFVSRFGGVEDLADLRVILALMGVVQMIPLAISGPIISLFSEREGREAGAGFASALEHMRWLWIFALVTGAALAVIWPVAVTVLFGPGFPQAAALGPMAIIAFIPTIVGTALSAGILVGGRTLPLVFVGIVQAAVMIGLAEPLVGQFGLTGFFLAQAAAQTTALALWLGVLGCQTRKVPLRIWMAPLTGATVLLCALLALDARVDEDAGRRLVIGLIGLPAFCIAIAFSALSHAERAGLLEQGRQATTMGYRRLATWYRRRD